MFLLWDSGGEEGSEIRTKPKIMEDKKNHLFTEIEINASPEGVWSVLTNWDKLKENGAFNW